MPMRSSFQRSAPAGKEVSKFCQTKYRCVKKVELGQRGCTACGRGGVALTTMAVTGLAAGMQLRRHRCVEFSHHASPRLHLCSLLTVGWDLRKDSRLKRNNTYQRRLVKLLQPWRNTMRWDCPSYKGDWVSPEGEWHKQTIEKLKQRGADEGHTGPCKGCVSSTSVERVLFN